MNAGIPVVFLDHRPLDTKVDVLDGVRGGQEWVRHLLRVVTGTSPSLLVHSDWKLPANGYGDRKRHGRKRVLKSRHALSGKVTSAKTPVSARPKNCWFADTGLPQFLVITAS